MISGKAIIRVDGKELPTTDDATLNPGGVNREPKTGGGRVRGYTEETVVPELTCSVYHTKDVSLKQLGQITGATILFETDSGAQWVMRDAWVSEAPALGTPAGTIDLKFNSYDCDEV